MDPQPSTSRNRRSIEQEIAALEAKLAAKRDAKRELDKGQKIIIGGMMLMLARKDEAARKRLVELLEAHVTRPADVHRILPIIEDLKGQQPR